MAVVAGAILIGVLVECSCWLGLLVDDIMTERNNYLLAPVVVRGLHLELLAITSNATNATNCHSGCSQWVKPLEENLRRHLFTTVHNVHQFIVPICLIKLYLAKDHHTYFLLLYQVGLQAILYSMTNDNVSSCMSLMEKLILLFYFVLP